MTQDRPLLRQQLHSSVGSLPRGTDRQERRHPRWRASSRVTQPPPWSLDETLDFLTAARSDPLYATFVIAIALGLRRGEVIGLRWQDVDLEKREIKVRKQRQRVGGEAYGRPEGATPEAGAAAAGHLHSMPVSALEDPAAVRLALDALSLRLDGKEASPRTAKRKRACLSDVLGLAVEEQYFTMPVNPIKAVKWIAPKAVEAVDPESVANPRQDRALLAGVRDQGPRGQHLEAFFGCLYYAAMRPAEASALREGQCHLPETGWGVLTLRQGIVRAGRSWTDDGTAHEVRHHKARAKKDSHPVPIPPHFVRLLRQHIATHGTAPDGRLFRTNRGGLLQETGYGEGWERARKDVLGDAGTASLLALRPYDLRHAGVSFWLSSGVDAMECARRAGHIVAVLHKVYAKVLDQTREHANSRIDAALREWNEPE